MFYSFSKLKHLTELRIESVDSVVYDQALKSMPDETSTPLLHLKRLSWFNFALTGVESEKKSNDGFKFDAKLFYQKLTAWFPNLEELFIYFDFKEREIIRRLEENIGLVPKLKKHRFEQFFKEVINPNFVGRHDFLKGVYVINNFKQRVSGDFI